MPIAFTDRPKLALATYAVVDLVSLETDILAHHWKLVRTVKRFSRKYWVTFFNLQRGLSNATYWIIVRPMLNVCQLKAETSHADVTAAIKETDTNANWKVIQMRLKRNEYLHCSRTCIRRVCINVEKILPSKIPAAKVWLAMKKKTTW